MPWIFLCALLLLIAAIAVAACPPQRRRRPASRFPSWLPDVLAIGLLALATVGFFWRVVAGQNWMPADGGDLLSFLYPTYRFAAAALRAGSWPLWNPHLYLGAPHVADIQAGLLYPPNLLLFLLRPDFPYVALQWLSIGHVWFAGAGMYLLITRGCRLARLPALAGALAFMFSDAFVVHFGNLNFNAVASWMPWVFWTYIGVLRAWEEARPPVSRNGVIRNWSLLPRAALPGVLLGVATLAGHIQATLFILLALAIYTLVWLWLQRELPQPGLRAAFGLAGLAGVALLTALLAAPVLLPALQLTGYTGRAAWNYTEAAGYSLSPAQWIGWLIPGFFGRGPQFHWGAWPRVEVGYLGILPLLLAGLALALRRDRHTWAWAGLAGSSFVLALGIYAIPHGWLTLLPGFGQLRAPARLVLVTDFALAVLAATGLSAALQPFGARMQAAFERAWRLVAGATGAVWAVGVPLAYLSLLLVQDRDPAIVTRISITLIAVVTFAGLLAAGWLWLTARRGCWARPDTLGGLAVALILLDLASTGAYQDLGNQDPSRAFQHPALAGFLAQQPGPYRIDARTGIDSLWQPDTALLYGLDDVWGLTNPVLLADVSRFWEGLGSRSGRLYDLLGVRYVLGRKDVSLDWQKFKLIFDGDPDLNVYENPRALPRVFLVSQLQSVPGHEAAWQAIHAPGFEPETTAVVEAAASPGGGGQGSISDLRVGPNQLSFRATVDGPAAAIISQSWYPGWKVWVNGRLQGQPLRADYAFQGVALAAGSQQVEMRFEPPLWRLGWVLAVLTGGVLLILAVARILATRRVYGN